MIYTFDSYELDPGLRRLQHAGQPIALQPRVFQVLVYLVQHRGRVVTQQELLEQLWSTTFIDRTVVARCVMAARKAIENSRGAPQYIQTVRGHGYRFVAAVEERDDAPPEATVVPLGFSQPPLAEERKQVTVLCCLLAHTTMLAEGLVIEAMSHNVQEVFAAARDAVCRYEGVIQRYVDHGFLALFGEPVSQEDHARRAVLAACELHQRLGQPGANPRRLPQGEEGVRMGVHTGVIVVGGHADAQPLTGVTLGITARVATRLAQSATPGTILISDATARLVQREVRCEAVNLEQVRWQTVPVPAYRVLGVESQEAGTIRAKRRVLSRFVGRKQELATLKGLLAQAAKGQGQVVGLVGAPGMGKSRLLAEFRQRMTAHPVTYLAGRCESYGRTTPYLPLVDLVRQQGGLIDADTPATCTAKVRQCLQDLQMDAEVWTPFLLHLLGVPAEMARLTGLSLQVRQARIFEALHQLFLQESRRQLLIMTVENLHWSDPTSEAYLALLAERLTGMPVLLLVTYRPGYKLPWLALSYASQIALQPLTPDGSRHVVRTISGRKRLDANVEQQILAQAGGNPFFLEELTRAVVEQGDGTAAVVLPDTIKAVLAARLDRLSPDAKHLLQTAAVIGKDVPVPLLHTLVELSEEAFHHHLSHLQAGELLYQIHLTPVPTYTFRHILTWEVAYGSLLTRSRQQLHGQIAQVLARQFPDLLATQPELVAHHYTEAGLNALAVDYWQRAGQRALERSAYVEASLHLTRGLEVLETLPVTPENIRHELHLQVTLGQALVATKGHGAPDVEHAYARALTLCEQVGDTVHLLPVLWGLWRCYSTRAELHRARQLGEKMLVLAERQEDRALLVMAHLALGMTLFFVGELTAARVHLEHGIVLYDPEQHHALSYHSVVNPGVVCRFYAAFVLWELGYPDQALQRSHEGLALATELSQPFSLAYALYYAAVLHLLPRRHDPIVHEWIETLMTLATEQGFATLVAFGTILQGWRVALQGQHEAGTAQMRQGMDAQRRVAGEVTRTAFLGLLAERYGAGGQPEEGLQVLAKALALVDQTGARFYEAELYRLKGSLHFQQGARRTTRGTRQHLAAAEQSLRQALEVARGQQAKSLELRAATSLSRLWQHQGKRHEAHQLLAAVYGWFTEGFDTTDLQEAKALLDTLA